MLIGITGRKCAGKNTVYRLLVERFGFSPTECVAGDDNARASHANAAENGDEESASTHYQVAAQDRCWRSDAFYVLPPELSIEQIHALKKRPYFLLLAVDAPTLVRFRRWQRRRLATECSPPLELAGELTDFLRKDDADYFGFPGDERLDSLEWDKSKTQREYNSSGVVTGSWRCQETADVRLHNNSDCLDDLANEIARLKLKEPDWLRPTWDTYFMRMAELASMRTNCMKRRVGAVIVRDHRVIATGYNGTPRGTKNCSEGGCQRCNHGARAGHALDACLCLHAEENAIIEAGRERCAGAILFTNLCPCLACTKKIVQAGIQEVVYGASYAMDTRSARLLAEANVYLRHYPCTWSRAGPHHHHLNSSIPLVSKDLAHLRLGR